jgi:hypothetical protein
MKHFVRNYLDSLDGHIQVAYLPPYAPDLNPVEYLWAWLKRHAMANYCPDNLNELQTTARNKLKSAKNAPQSLSLVGRRPICDDVMIYENVNSLWPESAARSRQCPRFFSPLSQLRSGSFFAELTVRWLNRTSGTERCKQWRQQNSPPAPTR